MNDFIDNLVKVDWSSVFVPTESILEVVIRGSIMYLVMFTMLRIFRRQAGTIGIADLLVVVVIADAAQNGMAGESKSVTEAVILIATIVFWNVLIDWIGYRSKFAEGILEPKKLRIIENGSLLRVNMRKEMITTAEVYAQMRLNGIESAEEVKAAYLESDGHFSFIKKDDTEGSNPNKNKSVI